MKTKEIVREAATARSEEVVEDSERRCFVGQCKKGDCCLEDGHAGSCHDGNMSEEEYEVERITAEKAVRGGKRKFLVKWNGWPPEDSTWESSGALAGAKEVCSPSPSLSPARAQARTSTSTSISTSMTMAIDIAMHVALIMSRAHR